MKKTPGDPHDRQVDAVDERCNNGWMRRLIEDPAKDVLVRLFTGNPETIRVTSPEQNAIAAWISLRAIVGEYDDFTPKIAHHTHRKMLMERQQIPENAWSIWIGNYEGRMAETLWKEHPFLFLSDRMAKRKKSNRATYANSQVLTYVIGKLLIHIIRLPGGALLKLWDMPPEVRGKLRRIWPPSGFSIVWPPPSLTDIEANIVSDAFQQTLAASNGAPRRQIIGVERGAAQDTPQP